MSKYGKIKWYRFNVARNIRLLEGNELAEKCQYFIDDIRNKKLDKQGFFKILIQDLETTISDARSIKKQKSREYDPFEIPRSGDGRIALFGLSNVGKSTLMNAITNTDVKTGDYLHTTRKANAGTLEYEQVHIQIVDLPGFLDFRDNWSEGKQILRVTRSCDAIILVIDLSMDIDRQYDFLIRKLEDAKLLINDESRYKIGIIATKGDISGSKENFEYLTKKTDYEIFTSSINHPKTLEKLKKNLFHFLEIMRVYSKPPKQKPNKKSPFICSEGSTIEDVASRIHKDFVTHFQSAKVWGPSVSYPGQRQEYIKTL
jgi:ribosome-interacting GTPase 1